MFATGMFAGLNPGLTSRSRTTLLIIIPAAISSTSERPIVTNLVPRSVEALCSCLAWCLRETGAQFPVHSHFNDHLINEAC
jgi:hypothetical protein